METQKRHFIIIDDSKLDCFIEEKMVRNTGLSEKITVFQNALNALELIKVRPHPPGFPKTVLLVDIQMPIMNGFEFVEAFEQLPEDIQERYVIYIATSSTNENDLSRMRAYKSVVSLMNKPLATQTIIERLSLQFA
jgi:CheY-like chemotaxis protein